MIWECCECGRTATIPDGAPPVRCSCRRKVEPKKVPTVCKWRSPSIGIADCGCAGPREIYICELKGLHCLSRSIAKPGFNLDGHWIASTEIAVCEGCEAKEI